MGSSILGLGVSGLAAAQRSITTVGHNIANVNNQAYSRQRVDLVTRPASFTAGGYIGNGVNASAVRRSVDDFLVNEVRVSTSNTEHVKVLNELAGQLDNLLADPEAGLSSALDRFFGSMQDLSDDPVSLPARNALLGEARVLARRINGLDRQIVGMEQGIAVKLRDAISEVNTLSGAIADLNQDIQDALGVGAGAAPNDLLDRRDELVRQLSELIDVSVAQQDGGSINISVGNGQPLVIGARSSPLTTVGNPYDTTRPEVATEGSRDVISQFLSGGRIGGLLEARSDLVDVARNIVGRVAISVAESVNEQHGQGMDLDGNLGGLFFNALGALSPSVAGHEKNPSVPAPIVSAAVSDVGRLTTSDYVLKMESGRYLVTRLSDGSLTDVSAGFSGPGFPPGPVTVSVDGIDLTVEGAMKNGDSFLVRPTRFAGRQLEMAIADPRALAAASPAVSAADLSNTGSATVSPADVKDPVAYIPDNYEIVMTDATSAAAGPGIGAITDGGANDGLVYELRFGGQLVYSQAEGAPALASLDALATEINDDAATTGVRAYVEGGTLHLARDPARGSDINVTESLLGASDGGADTVTGYFGATLTGAATSSTITLDAAAGSYVILDGTAAAVASGAYASNAPIGFIGLEVTLSGNPQIGDRFTVAPNAFGVGDNRNALALSDLQLATLIDSGTATFQDAYGDLVVQVGILARESSINLQAQTSLRDNAIVARDAVSGVNLDEEAADLMRFQQAYQASAQVIAAADTIFQELINAVRG